MPRRKSARGPDGRFLSRPAAVKSPSRGPDGKFMSTKAAPASPPAASKKKRPAKKTRRKPTPRPAPGNPSSLAIEAAAGLLSKAIGMKVAPAEIRRDIKNGAPVNPDGTINLVNYTAWLLKELNGKT